MKRTLRKLVLCCVPLIFCGCPTGELLSGASPYDQPSHYFSSMNELALEVAYDENAAPFVGPGINSSTLWSFTENNLNALFANRQKSVSVVVPMSLADMEVIPAQAQTVYSQPDISALAAKYRKQVSTDSRAVIFVLFVNGIYQNAQGQQPDVAGMYLPGTSTIAIFKGALQAISAQADELSMYVEQAALVHQLGHVLGLVNNGIPMVTAHQDIAHGLHCKNANCILNWQNENVSAIVQFVQTNILNPDVSIVLRNECLNDAHAYLPPTSAH
jgi:predicted Zn-dependent protease